jgi:hypothetical protein
MHSLHHNRTRNGRRDDHVITLDMALFTIPAVFAHHGQSELQQLSVMYCVAQMPLEQFHTSQKNNRAQGVHIFVQQINHGPQPTHLVSCGACVDGNEGLNARDDSRRIRICFGL